MARVPGEPSLRLDAEFLGRLFPERELALEEFGRVLGRARALRIELEAELRRKLAHLRSRVASLIAPLSLLDDVRLAFRPAPSP